MALTSSTPCHTQSTHIQWDPRGDRNWRCVSGTEQRGHRWKFQFEQCQQAGNESSQHISERRESVGLLKKDKENSRRRAQGEEGEGAWFHRAASWEQSKDSPRGVSSLPFLRGSLCSDFKALHFVPFIQLVPMTKCNVCPVFSTLYPKCSWILVGMVCFRRPHGQQDLT